MRYYPLKTAQKRTFSASDFPVAQEVVPPGREVSSAPHANAL
jgi:hypothetical protein